MRKLKLTAQEAGLLLVTLNRGPLVNGQFVGNTLEQIEMYNPVVKKITAAGKIENGICTIPDSVVIELDLKESVYEGAKNRFLKQSGGWNVEQADALLSLKDKLIECPLIEEKSK